MSVAQFPGLIAFVRRTISSVGTEAPSFIQSSQE